MSRDFKTFGEYVRHKERLVLFGIMAFCLIVVLLLAYWSISFAGRGQIVPAMYIVYVALLVGGAGIAAMRIIRILVYKFLQSGRKK